MIEKNIQSEQKGKSIPEIIKDSLLHIITLIFVLLYAGAYVGKLDPLKDNALLTNLEPIIFILIGFCFGRLPAMQNEQSLKDEIARLTQKADAAQFSKEKAQIERETLEEKIKNARTALKTAKHTYGNLENTALKTVSGILDS